MITLSFSLHLQDASSHVCGPGDTRAMRTQRLHASCVLLLQNPELLADRALTTTLVAAGTVGLSMGDALLDVWGQRVSLDH